MKKKGGGGCDSFTAKTSFIFILWSCKQAKYLEMSVLMNIKKRQSNAYIKLNLLIHFDLQKRAELAIEVVDIP